MAITSYCAYAGSLCDTFLSKTLVHMALSITAMCLQAHYATILRLKQYFPFSLIDAMGSLEDTRAQISRELRYQSSLDLDESTYSAIRHLPLAQDLVRASRQQLVHRLDTYSKRHHKIFMEVILFFYPGQCSRHRHASWTCCWKMLSHAPKRCGQAPASVMPPS